jgi:biotin carboxyl carrier protein
MRYVYHVGDEVKIVEVERDGDDLNVKVDDRVYRVKAQPREGGVTLDVDGKRLTAWVADNWVGIGSAVIALNKADKRKRRAAGAADRDTLSSVMPGQVRSVLVSEGDPVEKGQTLVLLEAMKMEIKVAAPHAGKVAKVLVSAGQVVERGQQLIEIAH